MRKDVASNAVAAQQGPSTSFGDHAGKYAADIETKRIETERKMAADRLDAWDHLFAIFGSFGLPVAMVAIVFYFHHRRTKLAHETLRMMIEKGMPITPELVAELRSKRPHGTGQNPTRRSGLFPGLVLAGIGTALLIRRARRYQGRIASCCSSAWRFWLPGWSNDNIRTTRNRPNYNASP